MRPPRAIDLPNTLILKTNVRERRIFMKRCPKCGRAYSDFTPECSVCKLPLQENAVPPQRRPVAAEPQRQPRRPAENPQARYQSPAPRKKKPVLGILAAVFAILLAAELLFDRAEEKEYEKELSGTISGRTEAPAEEGEWQWEEPQEPVSRQGAGDSIICTIDGQELELNQTKAFILGDRYMKAEYECMNPRGEWMYHLALSIKSNAGPGTYTSEDSSQIVTVLLTKKGNSATYSADHTGGGVKLYGRTTGSYTLKITDRSDDWLTYGGTLEAVVEPMTGDKTLAPITIEDGFFQFTLE